MGSTNPQILTGSAFALGEAYSSNATDPFEVGSNDSTTLIIDVDTQASVTGITLKPQVWDGEGFVDLYSEGESGFVVQEFTIPLAASTAGQKRAIRLDTLGIRDMRVMAKLEGGIGSLNSIKAIRDGSNNNTPPS